MDTGIDLEKCKLSFADRSFTVNPQNTTAGPIHCFKVPVLCQLDLVNTCIQYLKEVFPPDQYNVIAGKYYVMLNNQSGHSASSYGLCDWWGAFVRASFSLLGLREEGSCSRDDVVEDVDIGKSVATPSPPHAKRPKKSGSLAGAEVIIIFS